jgi:hypothetical protein
MCPAGPWRAPVCWDPHHAPALRVGVPTNPPPPPNCRLRLLRAACCALRGRAPLLVFSAAGSALVARPGAWWSGMGRAWGLGVVRGAASCQQIQNCHTLPIHSPSSAESPAGAAVRILVRTWGPVDVLVACAGSLKQHLKSGPPAHRIVTCLCWTFRKSSRRSRLSPACRRPASPQPQRRVPLLGVGMAGLAGPAWR